MNLSDYNKEELAKAIMELVEQNKFGPPYPSVDYDHDKTDEWIRAMSTMQMQMKLDSEHEEDEMCNAYRIERTCEWELDIMNRSASNLTINVSIWARYFPYPPKQSYNTICIQITEYMRGGGREKVQIDHTNFESFSELLSKKLMVDRCSEMYGI
jgi:hypothetical protein